MISVWNEFYTNKKYKWIFSNSNEIVLPLSVVSILYTTDCIVSAGACVPDGSLQPQVWWGASGHGTILLHL